MKTIYINFLVLLGLLTSCDQLLDIDPEFSQDAESFFNTPEDYERALVGAYDLMQTSYLQLWIGEIASDNAIAGGESVNDSRGLHEIESMTHGGVNEELRSLMRFNFAGISRVNYIFENRDNIDFDGKQRILAEAAFLRGYYYFVLVSHFGDVPLLVDRRASINELSGLSRTPKAEVYAQIERDLQTAIDVLAWNVPVTGRITKGAAMALLGKVYLFQGKNAEAAEVLGDLITNNQAGYGLFNDYSRLFYLENENINEDVLTIQYSGQEGGGYGCFVCLEGNAAVGFHSIRQYNGPLYGDGNSYNLPTLDLYNAYEENDPRRDATVLDIEAFIASQPNPEDITYAIGGGGHTGFFNNKYIKRLDERGLPDDDLTSPLNYRVIRYADVLLMAAEAFQRIGNDARARTELNKGLLIKCKIG